METDSKRRPAKWAVLATVCGGLFIIMLQSNVINLAVPRIQADFGATLSQVEWITNGYLLVFTMLLVTLGRLGDGVGRKRIFMAGLLVYAAGALFSGLAPSLGLGMGGLVIGAVIQGVGGAAMMPATQSLIAATFAGKERGLALGIWGAVSGLAVAVGPTLGGLLTDRGLGPALNAFFGIEQGWRYIYFINALLSLAVLASAARFVSESREESGRGVYDLVGVALSAAAVFCLVFGIIEGPKYGWIQKKADLVVFGANLTPGSASATPFFMAAALVFGAALAAWERRMKGAALIDFALFRNGNFASGSLVAAILSFAMMGTFFLVPVFLQGVLKFTAVSTGLALLPMALAVIVASPLSSVLTERIGPKWTILAGLAIMSASGFALARFSPETTLASLALPFVAMGAGIGLAMSPITATALATVPVGKVGGASGLLSMLRQMGSVLGIAIMASLFSSYMGSAALARVQAVDPAVVPPAVTSRIAEGLAGGASARPDEAQMDKMLAFYAKPRAAAIKGAISEAMLLGLCDSINATFRWAAAVAALGAAASLLLANARRAPGEGGVAAAGAGEETA